jgi:hypothetical protein
MDIHLNINNFMKYFIAVALIIFMRCNNQHTPDNNVPPEPVTVDTAKPVPVDITKPGTEEPQPPLEVYNDNITLLSMSNSFDTGSVNDNLTIYVQVKNTGDDICTLCNVGIRYSLKDITGGTAFDSEITDGSVGISNLMPGQSGTLEIKFPVTQMGSFTFYLTDLFGAFKGTNSTKHFNVPGDAKSYLTVLQ